MPSAMKLDTAQAVVAHPNHQLSRYFRQYLQEMGFGKIITTDHSTEAVKSLSQQITKLVLVDYDLQEFGGPDFVKFVRLCDPPLQEAAVCVTIAKPNIKKVLAARDAGANEIIALPLTQATLSKKVNNALRNPAPFIKHPTYIGPCRRRQTLEEWGGIDRRQNSPVPARQARQSGT